MAQYPLGMGTRGKESTSNALAVQLDESGRVKYSAIARQGHSADKVKLTTLFKLVYYCYVTKTSRNWGKILKFAML